jgi:hypothetical protein
MNNLNLALSILKERENNEIYFEKYFKIRDRETAEIIPFKINSSQRKLKNIIDKWEKGERETLFIIILKARRRGFSTYVEADIFKRIMHEKNRIAMVISYDDDSANNINDMANLFYQYLPASMKPERRASRGNGIILENPKYDPSMETDDKNSPGLQSQFLIETSNNVNAGSSYNIHYLHISELGKWKGDVKTTMTSLLQAVPNKNSIVVIESTAKGYNYFKELWDEANAYVTDENGKRKKKNTYIPLFVPWFEDEGYTKKYTFFKLTNYDSKQWGNEKELKDRYDLTYDQLEWRRWCISEKCGGDLNTFHQEMPASPEEAFLSTGTPVFDNAKVEARKEMLRQHYKISKPIRGKFEYTTNKDKTIDDSKIIFVPDEQGVITIYKEPEHGKPYVIGADTAGEGSNFFAAHCLDNTNGMQVATYHCQMNSDLFACQMYCLGTYYNTALLAIEMNYDYAPIQKLTEYLMYWHVYKREIVDNIAETVQEKYGFRTTQITRPLIISNLVATVRESIETFNDIDTLLEMLEFAKDKNGIPCANPGKSDDLVMAAAIAHYCRKQMWTEIDERNSKNNKDTEDDDDDDKTAEQDNWMAD